MLQVSACFSLSEDLGEHEIRDPWVKWLNGKTYTEMVLWPPWELREVQFVSIHGCYGIGIANGALPVPSDHDALRMSLYSSDGCTSHFHFEQLSPC